MNIPQRDAGPTNAEIAAESPIMWDTTSAPSVFDPVDWFRHCEEINGRRTPEIPQLAIQTVMPAHLDIAVARFGAVVDDFTLADHPIALFEYKGVPVSLGLSAKGSYAAGGLDELIAMGARRVVFLGGSASLVHHIPVDTLFVPTSALRDDGVSLHYQPPSRYNHPAAALAQSLIDTVTEAGLPGYHGPVWTTTAHFRQSLLRLHAFRQEGCLAVNNEAATVFAVGWHREVEVAALLMTGDTLANDRFEVPQGHPRLYQSDAIGQMLELSLRALTSAPYPR